MEAYDYVEVAAHVEESDTLNPFLDTTLNGSFSKADGTERKDVSGFCDAADGSSYRVRFMPASTGDYSYSITFQQGAFVATQTGKFTATAGHRRGPVRVDPEYRWHFIWEGTGEHCFFNGTTAFWLMGWREDRIINHCIERLQRLKINRIRVLLSGAGNLRGELVRCIHGREDSTGPDQRSDLDYAKNSWLA